MAESHQRLCLDALNGETISNSITSLSSRPQKFQDGTLATLKAPINRLPNEVLFEIFAISVFTLPSYMASSLDLSSAPWLLTRICKLWRDIALSNSQLWSTFNIHLDPHYSQFFPTSRLAKVHLERSRPCDLSIHANFSPYPHYSSHPIFSLILKHSERWKSVRFDHACHWALSEICVTKPDYPLLKELHLLYGYNQLATLDGFRNAPLLYSLSIDGFRLEYPSPTSHVGFPYHQITKLVVSRTPLQEVVRVMGRMPILEECVFNNCLHVNGFSNEAGRIRLPCLALLRLGTYYTNQTGQDQLEILKILLAPKLVELSIEMAETNIKECLQAFFCQSFPHIEKLVLCYSAVSSSVIDGATILGILWRVPTLRKLQMGGFILDDELLNEIFSLTTTPYSTLVPCPVLESLDFHGFLDKRGNFFRTIILPQMNNGHLLDPLRLIHRVFVSWLAPMKLIECSVKSSTLE
ncbi:hypothetical protein BDZ94DRAFT_1316761 [Collybia nuda]|uniref:F-box domain-containing protein n=1 Tax=Collybia nuda TaxID=64659 RepID=A0A9P5YGR0_9AGAR|nr:hypothetical protein BDZ94DRAFT_1316761 [Collybia nuda]